MSALKKSNTEEVFHEAANDGEYQRWSIRGLVAAVTLAGAQMVHAAPITAPEELADAGASVLVIGAAVFAIAIGIKVYKWVRRAL